MWFSLLDLAMNDMHEGMNLSTSPCNINWASHSLLNLTVKMVLKSIDFGLSYSQTSLTGYCLGR